MKLRNLIKLVGIIVLAWPIQAHTQPSVGTRHIGVLTYLEENDPQSKIYLDAFVQTLQKLGWTVAPPFTWTRFSKAPNPPIFPSSSRQSLSSSSTSKPPSKSGS